MKKFIFGFLLGIHQIASSQVATHLQVTCFPLTALAELLTEFKEVPFAIGKVLRSNTSGVEENSVILFVNTKTGSWTVAEKHKSGLYCVLSGGSDFVIISSGEKI